MRSAMSLPALVAPVLAFAALLLPASVGLAAPAGKDLPITPNTTAIAVYVPPSFLTARSYLPAGNLWIEPGKAFSDSLTEVGRRYFPTLHLAPAEAEHAYALLVDLEPKWKVEAGKLNLSLGYGVYDATGKDLLSGDTTQSAPIKANNFNAAAAAASTLAISKVMAAIQARLKPDPALLPSTGSTARIDYAPLVDRSKPLRTGTAFFINQSGNLLTAAHVSRDCMLIEAHQDGATFPVKARASSALLDVAVLDSGKPRAATLALRQGHGIVLGEAVTSVGYPLSGLLGDTPNLTRGNISASKGLRGSMGMFQFSAPIQPGNSGGPIVSENGELLGMAVSTLNAEALAKLGHIPQNINFALDARYVAMFLQREQVPFQMIQAQGPGSMQVANQAALSNTVQLNCYQ